MPGEEVAVSSALQGSGSSGSSVPTGSMFTWLNSLLQSGVGIANVISQIRSRNKQNELYQQYIRNQLRMQREQNQWNLQQWYRQNEYNDPAHMMSRFKNAGLNPNLVYGQLNGGQAGPLESAHADVSAPDSSMNAPIDFSGIGQAGMSINQMFQQKELHDEQIRRMQVETRGKEIDNAINEKELNRWDEKRQAEMEQLRSSINNMNSQTDKITQEIDNLKKEGHILNEKLLQEQMQTLFDRKTFDDRVNQVKEQLHLTTAQAEYYQAAAQLVALQQVTEKLRQANLTKEAEFLDLKLKEARKRWEVIQEKAKNSNVGDDIYIVDELNTLANAKNIQAQTQMSVDMFKRKRGTREVDQDGVVHYGVNAQGFVECVSDYVGELFSIFTKVFIK